jgi:hypothetical protein
MVRSAHVVALVVTVVLVTSHVAFVDAQPRARSRRAGASSGNNGKAVGRDPDPARLPPGRDAKVLPEGQAGALSKREDPFDDSFDLVEDKVSILNIPAV